MKKTLTKDQIEVLEMVLTNMRVFKMAKGQAMCDAADAFGVTYEWIQDQFKYLGE